MDAAVELSDTEQESVRIALCYLRNAANALARVESFTEEASKIQLYAFELAAAMGRYEASHAA